MPVLIDLLAELPPDRTAAVEEVLTQLAGEQGPALPAAGDAAARKRARDAWAAWWKEHGSAADLTRLRTDQHWLGYTLLMETGGGGRVLELGRDGKPRWTIEGILFPVDAVVLPGNRVLIAEYSGRKVTERDFKGNILWQKENLNGQPINVQRLANGHTFIATDSQIVEVDRTGKEVLVVNTLGALTAAYKARNGQILVLTGNGQCVRLDASGKQIKSFPSNREAHWTTGLDLLPNGRILITQPNRNKVAEYDADGRVLLEVDTPSVTTATGLPNGHVLAASSDAQRVFEVDRKGKVVWEYKDGNPVFRARRR
jgi:hypothetical protein